MGANRRRQEAFAFFRGQCLLQGTLLTSYGSPVPLQVMLMLTLLCTTTESLWDVFEINSRLEVLAFDKEGDEEVTKLEALKAHRGS